MTATGWAQIGLFFVVVLALVRPMGAYMFRVFEGKRQPLPSVLGRAERLLFRLCGVDPAREQTWPVYAFSLLAFSLFGLLGTYAIERLQHLLPLNPQHLGPVEPALAFNTAASFTTNTNWQSYTPESTMGYLTQMAGLAWHNFTSAAAGIAIALALARGFTRTAGPAGGKTIGNFWVDLVRATLYVLLPISFVYALFLVSQGVLQNLAPYRELVTLEGAKQVLAMGPTASQEAIKMLGTNGGGFFNANSAHPFENPTALTNFVQMLSILVLPSAIVLAFGRMVGDTRQGWTILAAMAIVLVAFMSVAFYAEMTRNPRLTAAGVATDLGNYEGKDTRFGVVASTMFAAITTGTSCGAVNSMHDSFMPLGGAVPLSLILLGEVIFGGVGTGLYTMLVYVLTAVFIAGLMIGRTPEYLGKRIESYDMKMVSIAILLTPIVVLSGAALSLALEAGRAAISNPGPHGLSQILYAWGSSTNNNGSAFAGVNVNTRFYNLGLAVAMWLGRFGTIIPVLALAGNMALKKRSDVLVGKMPTHGPLFVGLLIGTVFLVGALTYVPALALGPAAEHLQLFAKAAQ